MKRKDVNHFEREIKKREARIKDTQVQPIISANRGGLADSNIATPYGGKPLRTLSLYDTMKSV